MMIFRELETKNTFQYCDINYTTEDVEWGKKYGATHLIHLNNVTTGWAYRYAVVKKTVAYIMVDEDVNGPIWEKWNIKQDRNN